MTRMFQPWAGRSLRGPAISAILLCALHLSAYQRQAPRGDTRGETKVTLDLKTATSTDDAITVTYTVRNQRRTPVYVFNLLYHTSRDGTRATDPSLAYVFEEQGVLTAGKFLQPIPAGRKVESTEIPYLDRLEPGAAIEGHIRITRPIKAFDAYLVPDEMVIGKDARQIQIRIGFLDSSPRGAQDALIEPASGVGAGHFICDYGLGLQSQELLEKVVPLTPAK